MRFLPNHPRIKAAMCCGNTDCGNKEAEAEAEPLPLDIMCPDCCSMFYCTVDCQKIHSKNHQHQCNQDAEELQEWHNAAENTDNDDDKDDTLLFRPIPQKEECHICLLPHPVECLIGSVYYECCGKLLCRGCYEENCRVNIERENKIPPCPFCREPRPKGNDFNIRVEKRMKLNDSGAIYQLSKCYQVGTPRLPKDPQKGFKLCLRAAELRHAQACNSLALYYEEGVVVPKDMTKARQYYKTGAILGNIYAHHNLGVDEWKKGHYRLASRHYLVSAAAGHTMSLITIAEACLLKLVTLEEFSTALTSYRNVHKEEWSITRERAAAALR